MHVYNEEEEKTIVEILEKVVSVVLINGISKEIILVDERNIQAEQRIPLYTTKKNATVGNGVLLGKV